MEFRETTLANGLEIVAECNPKAYSTAVGFFVRTGSRDETDENWGVSHFLEHMTFKGTPSRTAADVNRELDEIGSNANAYTSQEQTVYHAAFLPECLDRAVDILADMMRPSLRDEDFDSEKKVILQEIARADDEPPFGAYDRAMELHYAGHPLSRNVLGSTDSVSALSVDQMKDYFRQRYSAGNLTLVGAGNVDFDQFVRLAEERCADWENFETSRVTPRAEDRAERELMIKENSAQQYVIRVCNGPSATDDERHAARILGVILGDHSGSRMFWDLIDSGKADTAMFGPDEYQGTGSFFTYLCCFPEDTVENLEILDSMMQDVQNNGVTEKELEQAKSKVCASIVLRSERSANRLFHIGDDWIQRKEYHNLRDMIDLYKSVTLDDINAALNRFPLTSQTTVAVGPLTELPGFAVKS